MVGFLILVSVHFYKCLSCFFSSSLLYSFLQAGRFTTKRQRESPINLVPNHVLDSSVDLCLCPSVCIFLFYFPSLISIFSLFNLPLPSINHFLFICDIVDRLFRPPHRPHTSPIFYSFYCSLPRLPHWLCSVWFFYLFFKQHQRIFITYTHWCLFVFKTHTK